MTIAHPFRCVTPSLLCSAYVYMQQLTHLDAAQQYIEHKAPRAVHMLLWGLGPAPPPRFATSGPCAWPPPAAAQ